MALWTHVYSGFDTEEETVNFGARAFAETNGSIYESFTIATIQTDGEVIFTAIYYLKCMNEMWKKCIKKFRLAIKFYRLSFDKIYW